MALLIAGALSLLFIPTWGPHIALVSVALIIVGATTLAVGTSVGISATADRAGSTEMQQV
jgi:hypothetical protein